MRRVALCSLFVLLLASSLRAEGPSLGLGAGFVNAASSIGSAPWFTANVRFAVAKNVAVEPEVGFWSKSESYLGLADVSFRDINVGATALYLVPSNDKLHFVVGAGIGAHMVKGAVGILGFEASDTSTEFGPHVLGGLEYQVADAVRVFANARYVLAAVRNRGNLTGLPALFS